MDKLRVLGISLYFAADILDMSVYTALVSIKLIPKSFVHKFLAGEDFCGAGGQSMQHLKLGGSEAKQLAIKANLELLPVYNKAAIVETKGFKLI
jgi:hypothetical protein